MKLDDFERDILESVENGIPYQNLIQILIHQYAQNKISLGI